LVNSEEDFAIGNLLSKFQIHVKRCHLGLAPGRGHCLKDCQGVWSTQADDCVSGGGGL
jgi:hypothetical protein